MHSLNKAESGITLIELLIVIAIVCVLSSIALPAFGSLVQSGHARSARSALTVSISQARSSAVMRRQYVAVCPSADQIRCDRSLKWHHGWLVFVDADNNGERDTDEDIVGASQALDAGIAIVSTRGRYRIRYQADGSSDGSNLTLTVCDRRGAASASTLVMNNSGRLRSGKPSAAQAAAACAAIGT